MKVTVSGLKFYSWLFTLTSFKLIWSEVKIIQLKCYYESLKALRTNPNITFGGTKYFTNLFRGIK